MIFENMAMCNRHSESKVYDNEYIISHTHICIVADRNTDRAICVSRIYNRTISVNKMEEVK